MAGLDLDLAFTAGSHPRQFLRPTPDQDITRYRIDVTDKVRDDSGRICTLSSSATWRGSPCFTLPAGRFLAEIHKTTMWIDAPQGGNPRKIICIK